MMYLDIYTPSQVQMTDGNKYVMLTDCKQINRLTFLLLDDVSLLLFIKLSSIHHSGNALNTNVTSLQGFQMLR